MHTFSKWCVFVYVAMVFCLLPILLSAQTVVKEIDLDDGIDPVDWAFGMKLSPDGKALYVAICGDFNWTYTKNNRLVKIDTTTDTIVAEQNTGIYPEEIEFRVGQGGNIELIFVSNNDDHTITVLNPDLSPEATISLASMAYPTGLVMGPQNRHLYVSSLSETIFVVDTDPGPSYLQVVDTYHAEGSNNRLALYDNKLLIAGSQDPLGLWVYEAVLHTLDLENPTHMHTLILDNGPIYASCVDIEVTNQGFAYVTDLDYNDNPYLFEIDLNSNPPQINRSIDLSTPDHEFYLEHGLGASPDKNTLIVTYMNDSYIRILGRKAGCILDELDLDPMGGQINEAVFTLDGEKLYLTNQNQSKVYVVEGLPEHGLHLSGTKTIFPGGSVHLGMVGGEPGQPGLLMLSLTLGPLVAPTYTLDIGWPLWILVLSLFNPDCTLFIPQIHCPNDPLLSGTTVYFQGLTQDGDFEFRPSTLHVVEIL